MQLKELNKAAVQPAGRPVRILQCGEGNFLRAFGDWQIDIANEKGVTDAGVAVVPEMFDAETILMSRAASREVFDRIVAMINDFKAYFRSYGQHNFTIGTIAMLSTFFGQPIVTVG